MRIGIVSDSHAKADRLGRALALLIERGAEAIVHCGDLGSADCLRELGRAGVQAYAVGGNMDDGQPHLPQVAAGAGVEFSPVTIEVPLPGGKYLVATHGHHHWVLDDLICGGEFPYICHGHTHTPRDDRRGSSRIINPGALTRANPPSAAILDVATDTLTFLQLT